MKVFSNIMFSKRILVIVLVTFMATSQNYSQNWTAEWIWQESDGLENTWVAFRKEVVVSSVPQKVIANIAVDSKYWLYINGQLVKFEGGSARGPSPGNTWYEEINITPYLHSGKNTFAILAWYWGRETFKGTHIDSGKGGLVFQADFEDFSVISDNTWKVKTHSAYNTKSGGGNNRIVPFNVDYDATKSLGDWSSNAWYTSNYDDKLWKNATEKGIPPSLPWGNLEKSDVTLKNHGLSNYETLQIGNTIVNLPYTNNTGTTLTIDAKIPFNKQITPYLSINSVANQQINISTNNLLNTITAKYKTKTGDQKFEAFSWMSGNVVRYQIPSGVTVNDLKYRWLTVGEEVGSFTSDDPFFERLWWMGKNTLFVNARDNFMDCPDRERSLWIGDVADQASYLFYTMDKNGRDLLKKAIKMTMLFSLDGNIIRGQVPGGGKELPSQSLQFISQAIWQYYLNTGDIETLAFSYDYIKNYLALWNINNNTNLINMRPCSGDLCWNWIDWDSGNTIDRIPVFNALYYYALRSTKLMAETLKKPQSDIDWYDNRIQKIKKGFDANFWKDGFYSSNTNSFKDDRTNALAIITGLADSDKHEEIVKNVLIPNYYCSPHYEWMIEEAMCIAGNSREALFRMKARYLEQINNENTTTLNEYFTIGRGTDNHAWNAPNTILTKYIVGIAPLEIGWSKYHVLPNLVDLTRVTQTFSTVKGNIAVAIQLTENSYQLNLTSPKNSIAVVGIPKTNIITSEIKLNETLIWKNGNFIESIANIGKKGENEKYIWFELNEGTWHVIANGQKKSTNYVKFTTPINGETIDKNTNLIVQAEAGNTTQNVTLFINNQLVRTITNAPFTWGEGSLDQAFLSNLSSGNYSLKLVATNFDNKEVKSVININSKNLSTQLPYTSSFTIPGKFEAENYDLGGKYIAYYDIDDINQTNDYRNDGVDIGSGGSGFTIGFLATTEWLEYTVNAEAEGFYDLSVNYSSGKPTPGASLSVSLFDEGIILVDDFRMPNTGGWSSYKTTNLGSYYFTEGKHIIRFYIKKTGFNLDWFEFTKTKSLSTTNIFKEPLFTAYPNPNKNGIYTLTYDTEWTVYSIRGIQLLKGKDKNIDISTLNSGIYILKTPYKNLKLVKE